MVFWRITWDGGLDGWQILTDALETVRLTDKDGNDLTGGFDYSFVEVSETPPAWWSEPDVSP